MKTLRFYGTSDDLLECEGDVEDEACNNGRGDLSFVLESSSGRMRVAAVYVAGGVWAIGVCQVEENDELPLWPIQYGTHENGYSALLRVDCPDDVQVADGKDWDR